MASCFAAMPPTANAADKGSLEDIVFTDRRGNEVTIPGGSKSCAVKVVEFIPGTPKATNPAYVTPENLLGAPDNIALSLGGGGVVVLEFDVYIYDGPGNDIYVFEIGSAVEATRVEVSKDLEEWIYVGDAAGAISGVDMHGYVEESDSFRYVRLTDLRTSRASSSTPGADIDAVAGINVRPLPGLRIEVTTPPTKLTYMLGDKLDLSGMVVTFYSDGSAKNVTNYTVDPENGTVLNTPGPFNVTVHYEKGDVNFKVDVESLFVVPEYVWAGLAALVSCFVALGGFCVLKSGVRTRKISASLV